MKNSVRKLLRRCLPVCSIVTAFFLSGCDFFRPLEPFIKEHSAEITTFSITSPIQVDGSINGNDITITVPVETAVTHSAPRIYYTGSSISPALGVEQNFSYPVVYTVTAADGTTRDYTVTLRAEIPPGQVAYSVTKATYYVGLQDAIDASSGSAGSPDVIALLADIDITAAEDVITIPGTPNAKHVKLIAGVAPRAINCAGNITASLITVAGGGSLELGDDQVLIIDGKKASYMENKALITVDTGGTLKMSGGAVTLRDNSNYAIRNNGSFTMNDGSITGNSVRAAIPSSGGGGVYVSGTSTFTMSGGSITGNSVSNNNTSGGSGGGGVYVSGTSTFTMSGGSITGNSANVFGTIGGGGGVYVSGTSTFTMSGGSITGNSVSTTAAGTSSGGGGVYVYGTGSGSTFIMSGGSITGNSVSSTNTGTYSGGGGVYVSGTSTFTMSGGSITGNSANVFGTIGGGGGVYVYGTGSGSTFIMSGGSITGNSANTNVGSITTNNNNSGGGGVYVYGTGSGSTFIMSGGSITGNSANTNVFGTNSGGGGVYVYGTSTFTMSRGSISGNFCNNLGKSLYRQNSTPVLQYENDYGYGTAFILPVGNLYTNLSLPYASSGGPPYTSAPPN
ncbi:hypothetical protein FACS189462_0910 [Spirochaetia bacterium]|nr:hypothetical protein FACS189462_0910 [Spirochaetia bacterium]